MPWSIVSSTVSVALSIENFTVEQFVARLNRPNRDILHR